ncbi:hypothetical protein ACP4OV_012322 [Aristida adscensionis]
MASVYISVQGTEEEVRVALDIPPTPPTSSTSSRPSRPCSTSISSSPVNYVLPRVSCKWRLTHLRLCWIKMGTIFLLYLVRASVCFLMGEMEQQHKRSLEHYRNSLDRYKRSLRTYSNCPAAVRLGIAFCRYKLGQVEKARQAFQ